MLYMCGLVTYLSRLMIHQLLSGSILICEAIESTRHFTCPRHVRTLCTGHVIQLGQQLIALLAVRGLMCPRRYPPDHALVAVQQRTPRTLGYLICYLGEQCTPQQHMYRSAPSSSRQPQRSLPPPSRTAPRTNQQAPTAATPPQIHPHQPPHRAVD
jgi:hypothetical protein